MGRFGVMRMSPPIAHAERFLAMGTRVELHLFGDRDAAAIAARLREVIEAVDDRLTIHRMSPTTRLNERLRAGEDGSVEDAPLWESLQRCAALTRQTHGLFDPTVGMGEGRWADLEFDTANRRVRPHRPSGLDFGGVGKGIALDACIPILQAANIPSALLSLGESSILAYRDHPLGGAWPLAVPDPRDTATGLIDLAVTDRCVSISSTVGVANGDTRIPSDGAAVTWPATTIAVDRSGARAEAFSTALLAATPAQRAALGSGGGCQALHYFDLGTDRDAPAIAFAEATL